MKKEMNCQCQELICAKSIFKITEALLKNKAFEKNINN